MTLRSDRSNGLMPSAPTPTTNGQTSRFRGGHGDSSPDRDDISNENGGPRPSSAPGRRNGSESRDDLEHHQGPRRPVKPQLQRSKSDYAPRPLEDSDTDEDMHEWGARHGFEDHYQSEHIISQLASVSLPCFPAVVRVGSIRVAQVVHVLLTIKLWHHLFICMRCI